MNNSQLINNHKRSHTQKVFFQNNIKTNSTKTKEHIYNLFETLKGQNTNKIKRSKRKFAQFKRRPAQGRRPKCRPASKAGGL